MWVGSVLSHQATVFFSDFSDQRAKSYACFEFHKATGGATARMIPKATGGGQEGDPEKG